MDMPVDDNKSTENKADEHKATEIKVDEDKTTKASYDNSDCVLLLVIYSSSLFASGMAFGFAISQLCMYFLEKQSPSI